MKKDQKFIEVRDNIVEIINKILVGPIHGPKEELHISPTNFYTTGIIYPQRVSSTKPLADEDIEMFQTELEVPDSIAENTSCSKDIDNSRKLEARTAELEQKDYDSVVKDELSLITDFRPSAFGISVIVNNNSKFNVKLKVSNYVKNKVQNDKTYDSNDVNSKKKDKYVYNRKETNKIVEIEIKENKVIINDNNDIITHNTNREKCEVTKNLEFHTVARYYSIKDKSKFVVTLTLVHTKESSEFINEAGEYFFQPEISAYSDKSVFLPNDEMTDLDFMSNEELNNKMLYRKYKSFGTGHGVSVSWNDLTIIEDKKKLVKSMIIPSYEVLNNDFEPAELIEKDNNGKIVKDCNILYIKRLSGADYKSKKHNEKSVNKKDLVNELFQFVSEYEKWVKGIETTANNELIEGFKRIASRNISECNKLIKRMKAGINLIKDNPSVYKAFTDANKAMFIQRMMTGFSKQRGHNYGDLFPGNNDEPLPDFTEEYKYNETNPIFMAKWRPFQLAFMLSQIEGIVNPKSVDRDTTDLIWFTTGGGKTEAYLGLIAFTIFYRRLRAKESGDANNGAGVTVIMRYTLRLLNKQQFNRAIPLICSCELIRRQDNNNYGDKEISIGIWVGSSLTENNWADFIKNGKNIPIVSCPCCGTKMVKIDNKGESGCLGEYKRNKETTPYHLSCRNKKCDFYVSTPEQKKGHFSKHLPIYFIDDEIYKPDVLPTLIISTVDKFASLPWKKESFNLFNLKIENDSVVTLYPGPELIIQDELHLINSSLGSIYGIYEFAIDKLCSETGYKPKIVSATATVKNAEAQCRLLFGRSNFMQFPPPGIDADDSFFSRKQDKVINGVENWGRLYLGFQSSGFTNTVTQIRLVSVLLQLIPTIKESNKILDYYYPFVVYFNTIKELGKFRTLLEDDIVKYRSFLANIFENYFIPFSSDRSMELSSAMKADEITASLERLEKEKLNDVGTEAEELFLFSKGIRQKSDVLDFLQWDKSEKKSPNFQRLFNNKDAFEKLNITFDDSNIQQNKQAFVDKVSDIFHCDSTKNVANIISATNMISVGIDIPRFNVMQITGQPKSHSEYIQASSRVSREKPGMVITTYNSAKNRDRSHYEHFVDYHQSFYKYVEATSVTPFSSPALEKILPAVLISLMQIYSFKLSDNANSENNVNFVNDYNAIIGNIKLRVQYLCNNNPDLLEEQSVYIANIDNVAKSVFNQWKKISIDIPGIEFSNYGRYYFNGIKNNLDIGKINNDLFIQPQYKGLVPSWDEKFACMTSMRSVENSSIVAIKLNNK